MDNVEDDPLMQLALALSMQGETSVQPAAEGDGKDAGSSERMEVDGPDDQELQAALALSMSEDTPDNAGDEKTPQNKMDNPENSNEAPGPSVPKISTEEIASTLSKVLEDNQVSADAGPSEAGSTIDAELISSVVRSIAAHASRQGHNVEGTKQVGVGPRKVETHAWIDLAVRWMSPSTLDPALIAAAAEQNRGEIDKFLEGLLGSKPAVRSPFTVESAAAAVISSALKRKLTGQMQKLSELQAKCKGALASNPGNSQLCEFIRAFEAQLARKALEALKKDEDDIFFDGGQVKAEVQAGLSSGTISCNFMDLVAETCSSPEDAQACKDLLTMSFKMIQFDFTDNKSLGNHLYRLDILTRSPRFVHILTSALVEEVCAFDTSPAKNREAFEEASLLRQLLSVSTMVEAKSFVGGKVVSPIEPVLMTIRGYPSHRGEVEANQVYVRKMLEEAHGAAYDVLMRLVKSKHPNGATLGREGVLTWLSAVATISSSRTKGGERQALKRSARTLTDGFTLGTLSVALRFCRPFLKGEDKFLQRLDPQYYKTQLHRFGGRLKDQALAGNRQDPKIPKGNKWFPPDRDTSAAPHFVPEVFFLTQRLMNTALIPAVHRYSNLYEEVMRYSRKSSEASQPPHLYESLLRDSAMTQLLDPVFAGDVVKFMVLQAMWLRQLILNKDYDAFKVIPDHVVRNIGTWLIFVIQQGSALLLGDVNIGLLMESLVLFVEHRNLVKSPLVLSKIVELLLVMLSPQLHARGSTNFGAVIMRPGEAALVAAVLGTGVGQERLIPALMRLYAEADHVIGLDVDRDAFDKFSMRNCIDLILEEMWKDDICKASLTKTARQEVEGSQEEGVFAKYIGSVLNDLMYLFKDCFDRLADIHNIEVSMANASEWSRLDPVERQKKIDFYEGQQRTCKSFMRLSVTTLRLLNLLTDDKVVVTAFLKQPLSGRAAYGALRFLELLVGPGCANISVEKPEQYHFDRDKLLGGVCDFMLQLGLHQEFQKVLAEEQDFDAIGYKVFMQAKKCLDASHQVALSSGMVELLAKIQSIKSRGSSKMETNVDSMDIESYLFSMPEIEGLDDVYVSTIRPLAVNDFDASLPTAYNSAYNRFAQESGYMNHKGMKRLSRELRDLQAKSLLPIYPASSIVVRHDTNRIDKVRALITGPEGTPYGYGCFIFDAFFPPDYPNVPPLMNLETTGQGRARFNPNLYADGKVCLSLLGTWHGAAAHEKWNPAQSSLFQILVSIQGMIFVEDPYFNEPNVDMMRDTSEGSTASKSYNAELHLNNVRWAMIDQLKNPCHGFEEFTRQHFKLMRHRIIKQCKGWIEECGEGQAVIRDRLVASLKELHSLLEAL